MSEVLKQYNSLAEKCSSKLDTSPASQIIEKMYRNAHVYPKIYGDITKETFENKVFNMADMCNKAFTAEKQLELIKWLGKLDGKLEITCTYNKEKFILNFYFNRKTDKNPDPKYPYSNFLNEDIEILIASLINDIWQDLTETERNEIRDILKG